MIAACTPYRKEEDSKWLVDYLLHPTAAEEEHPEEVTRPTEEVYKRAGFDSLLKIKMKNLEGPGEENKGA